MLIIPVSSVLCPLPLFLNLRAYDDFFYVSINLSYCVDAYDDFLCFY
jgi:hypothetical protein